MTVNRYTVPKLGWDDLHDVMQELIRDYTATSFAVETAGEQFFKLSGFSWRGVESAVYCAL
jgi:hypothetical protein